MLKFMVGHAWNHTNIIYGRSCLESHKYYFNSHFVSVLKVTALKLQLSSLKEEYVELQDHLADIELKYQLALTASSVRRDDEDNKFNSRLQMVVTNLFNTQLYSDIVILLEDGHKLDGHKLILSARSDDWGGTNLQELDELDLTDIRYDVAYTMMKWVYTDETNIDEMEDTFLIELLGVATRFHLVSLHIRCQKALISCIDVDNCNKLYQISEELSAVMLKDYCLEYISENVAKSEHADVVVPSFQMNESLDDGHVDSSCDKEEDKNVKTFELEETKTKTSYECELCFKSFQRKWNLQRHVMGHISEKSYKCDACCIKFTVLSDLKEHLRISYHEPFKCDVCDETFNQSSHLKKHSRIHKVKETEEESNMADVGDKGDNSNENDKQLKNYDCHICQKSFPRYWNLQRHFMAHTGDKSYKCQVCKEVFSELPVYKEHIKTYKHEKMFNCEICGKTFDQSSNLKKHYRSHSGEKPYQCDVCGRSFSLSNTLERHSKTHTGEKPHKCDVCGRAFALTSGLNKHMRTHTGERPYECDICGKSFSEKYHLPEHRRTHTGEKPYKCDVCGKYYNHRGAFAAHKRIHTGVRPYHCDQCSKSFNSTGKLKMHRRIHTGERPYKCDVCGKGFRSSSHLSRHIKIH